MGQLKQTFKMRWDSIVVYGLLCVLLVVLYAIANFTREFFFSYKPFYAAFALLQVMCVALIIAIIAVVVIQYKKAGKLHFYELGFEVENKGQFFYHDIIYYDCIPQSNQTAKAIYMKTDDGREYTLSALMPSKAFQLFQEDYAAIWVPFMLEKIKNKQILTFTLQEDATSFKMNLNIPYHDTETISLSHQGIVLYDKFYPWNTLATCVVSWSGMLTIKDTSDKTVFLEPISAISQYVVFATILKHYVTTHRTEETHD